MTGVEAMQPFGEIGFQLHVLLPRDLRPAGIEQPGHCWIALEEIALLCLVVLEFLEQ